MLLKSFMFNNIFTLQPLLMNVMASLCNISQVNHIVHTVCSVYTKGKDSPNFFQSNINNKHALLLGHFNLNWIVNSDGINLDWI